MVDIERNQAGNNGNLEKHWQSVYYWGAVATCSALALLVLDIVVGSLLGGDISRIPATAAGRLRQFSENWLLGLYNHDLLNLVIQLILLPAYWALYAALRKVEPRLGRVGPRPLFIIGTTLFVMPAMPHCPCST